MRLEAVQLPFQLRGHLLILILLHVAYLVSINRAEEDHAAAEAAAYWSGRRVQQSEEDNLPTPIIRSQTDIDFQGESKVQECLEYYMDKSLEQPWREETLRREREGAADWANREGGAQKQISGIVTYLLMENAQRTLHLDLLLSLHCLVNFFGHRYPIAIFYTNGTTEEELTKLRNFGPPDVQLIFEEVHLDFPISVSGVPGGIDAFFAPPQCMIEDKDMWTSKRSCGCRCPAWRPQCWPLNWMHATRFFTAGMFRTRTFQTGNYDYFFRMDTDLFFVQPPLLDPFELMASRGCAMVYDRISREAPGCFDGFDSRTEHFFSKFYPEKDNIWIHTDAEMLRLGRGPAAVGGGWTIGDARLFTSPEYLRFADYFASGIYAHRWADQLFLLRGVALFGPRSDQTRDSPPVSVCLEPMFAGGPEEGFVHMKGGFREPGLLDKCVVQDWFARDARST